MQLVIFVSLYFVSPIGSIALLYELELSSHP
jgi:hypothetical protein